MNFLRITPKNINAANQFRLGCANFSVRTAQRTDSFQLLKRNSLTLQIAPKRNNSISATLTGIYTDISNSETVSVFQNALIFFHDYSGLPWWATIVLSTIGLRLCMFPVLVHTHKCEARHHLIVTKELPALSKELNKEVAIAKKIMNLDEQKAQALYRISLDKQYKKLVARDNCHPRKSNIIFLIQIPVWVCQSVSIRNILTLRPDPMAYKGLLAFTQLTVGGFLWIPNLTEIDASYILPVFMCILNLANIEMIALQKDGPRSKFLTYITALFRIISIGIVPLVASVPSCLSLYWCTSTASAFAQNIILLSPKTKRLLGIPTNTAYHMEQPYRTIAQRFVKQMERRKQWCKSILVPNPNDKNSKIV